MKNINKKAFIQYALQLGLSLIIGVTVGLLSPVWVLIGFGTICFLLALVNRLELALLAILVVKSTIIFEDTLPIISIGIGSLHITDFLMLALFGLVFFRGFIKPGLGFFRTPLNLPLLSFYSVMLFSTFWAIYNGSIDRVLALRGIRVTTYYLTFFIVVNLIQKKSQLKMLVNGIMILGTVVAVAMIVQYIVGDTVQLLPGRVEEASTGIINYKGVTRILPPGQSLLFLTFITLVVLLVIEKTQIKSIARIFNTGVLGIGVILTFNRNFWVGIGSALILLLFLIRVPERKKIAMWILIVVIITGITLPIISTYLEPRFTNQAEAFLERFATLFDINTLNEGSLKWRFIEIEYAIPQILAHPILGLGLGSYYRPLDSRLDKTNSYFRGYIHNGHLGLILNSGFLGYFCFLWLSFLFIWRGLRYWKTIQFSYERAIFLANTLTYIGIFVASVVNPIFKQPFWTPVFGIMMGVNEVILRLNKSRNITDFRAL